MKNFLRSLSISAAMVVFAAALAPLAHADTIYTYTGQAFTQFNNGYTCQSQYGECGIAGWFSFTSPLGDDFSGTVTPLAFSFTDGTQTFSSDPSSPNYSTAFDEGTPGVISLTTDANGNIQYWDFSVDLNSNTAWNLQSLAGAGGSEDLATAYTSGPAKNVDAPGTWTETDTTPEPATWSLMGAGVLALLGFAVKRRAVFVQSAQF